MFTPRYPRFGMYTVETFRRRQKQRHTGKLVGHSPMEVFQRMQRVSMSPHMPGNPMGQSPELLYLLERSILKVDTKQLQEIDKAMEAHDVLIPEQIAKAVEYRALQLQMDEARSKRDKEHYEYQRAPHEKKLDALEKEVKALNFKPLPEPPSADNTP